jgi:methionine biosynthesis protein MetW
MAPPSRYDSIIDPNDRESAHGRIVSLAASAKRVLDVGCATGAMGEFLARRFGCEVVGVEIDGKAAFEARRKGIEVHEADVEAVPLSRLLGGRLFDAVIFADVLEHLREPVSVLREARLLLAPSGRILVSFPNVAHASVRLSLLGGRFERTSAGICDATHLRFFTRESFEALCREAGLSPAGIDPVLRPLPPGEIAKELSRAGLPVSGEIERLLSTEEAAAYQYVAVLVPSEEARAPVPPPPEIPAFPAWHELRMLRSPSVDVVVVTWNSRDLLPELVESLRRQTYFQERMRLVVADNGSTDGTVEYVQGLESYPIERALLRFERNLGFAEAANRAIARCHAPFILLVNDDARPSPRVVSEMVACMEREPDVGACEARQSPREHPKEYSPATGDTGWCSACCVLLRRSALDEVGLFEPRLFMYAEDVELSWRMRLHGWRCVILPEVWVLHEKRRGRDPGIEYFRSFRNGFFLRAEFGTVRDVVLYALATAKTAVRNRDSMRHRLLVVRALFSAPWMILAGLRKRRALPRGRRLRFLFDGWSYGRYRGASDVLPEPPGVSLVQPGSRARREARHGDVPEGAVFHHGLDGLDIFGVRRDGVLLQEGWRVEFPLESRGPFSLVGHLAVPGHLWESGGAGEISFVVDEGETAILSIDIGKEESRRWRPFRLRFGGCREGARLSISFRSTRGLSACYVAGLHVVEDAEVRRREGEGPLVSVVIPTRNRAGSIGETLAPLVRETGAFPGVFEIIVVDSASSDETPGTLAALRERFPGLVTLRLEKPGAAAARNAGMDKARGDVFLFMDDDMWVRPGFAGALLRGIARHPRKAILGRIEDAWEGTSDAFLRFLRDLGAVNAYDFPDSENVPPDRFYTGLVVVPAEAWRRGARFDEGFSRYGVEDIDFGFRLLGEMGYRLAYDPSVRAQHRYFPRRREFLRKRRTSGESLSYFLSRHPEHRERFVFPRRLVRAYGLVRLLLFLSMPLFHLLYFLDTIRFWTGPVFHPLLRLLYFQERTALYRGYRGFVSGKSRPPGGPAV